MFISPSKPDRRTLACLLGLAVLVVFARAGSFEFVLFDDPAYVQENAHITGGLTLEGIAWVFTHSHGANWHPLTGLSHMLDCELFGLNPGGHHFTSVAIHALNAALWFLVLANLTGATGRSLFVAAVFALHPLRVESVAWVSERKDVLSGLFWILTIAAYARYARQPTRGRYAATLLVFLAGLMSKPMVVTLPLVLLLLDIWPLRRWPAPAGDRSVLKRLVAEKVPFLALSFVAGLITLLIQGKSATTLAEIPLTLRIENAAVSYFRYIGKLVWPTDLAFLYPYPDAIPLAQTVAAGAGLIALTVCALAAARRWPYATVGWLWYVLTLLPVIGLIQVGRQSFADRYTYLPHIGLLMAVTWGLGDLLARGRVPRWLGPVVGAAGVSALAVVAWNQLGFWRNSATLFERAIAVTANNSLAHHNLGVILLKQGKAGEAIPHLERALEYKPNYEEAHFNLGVALSMQGRLPDALPHYAEAVRLHPGSASWRNELGLILARSGREPEAIEQFTEAVRLDPDLAEAHNNLGVAFANQGRAAEAIEHFTKAVALRPDYRDAQDNLQRARGGQAPPGAP